MPPLLAATRQRLAPMVVADAEAARQELLGRGVSSCATCDGFFFRDHDIVVGAITAVGIGPGEPLVHWERGYWALSKG